MSKHFLLLARLSLIFVLLVVLAGSVVRATGSGMGCPDWPKCFGYYIPPSDPKTLDWTVGRAYLSGQMVIRDGALWVSEKEHKAADFGSDPWSKYAMHDYATFNPAHTWIEYINRLLGAVSGIPILLMFLLSVFHFKKDKITFFLSGGVLILLGFVAWLGKVVVDSNLTAHKITWHMAGAVAIVALLVIIIVKNRPQKEQYQMHGNKVNWILVAALLLSVVQIFLGTQVREGVDELVKSGMQRNEIPSHFSTDFYVHRTLAWLIIVVNLTLWWLLKKDGAHAFMRNIPPVVIAAELISGITLVYFEMPAFMQPVHLVAAFLLFSSLFFILVSRLKMLALRLSSPV